MSKRKPCDYVLETAVAYNKDYSTIDNSGHVKRVLRKLVRDAVRMRNQELLTLVSNETVDEFCGASGRIARKLVP